MASNMVVDNSGRKEYEDGLTNTLQGLKLSDEEIASLPSWMEGRDTALLWYFQQKRSLSHDKSIAYCLEKFIGYDLDEPEYCLLRFSVLLRLLIEYFLVGNISEFGETMSTIEYLYTRDFENNDSEYRRYQNIVLHIFSSTLAHIYAKDGNLKLSKEIAENLTPTQQMSNQELSTLWAIKVNFILHSGYDNCENEAVQLARKTLSLDPDNHTWKFLLARTLRQQRRVVPCSMVIPKEEIELFISALKQKRSATYLAFTAQAYRELATQTYRNDKNERGYFESERHKKIAEMHKIALKYYKESLKDTKNSASNLRRIGYGIMNLPRNIADYDLAEICLLKSIELWDIPNTYHILGTFYQRYRKDYNAALECLEKAAQTKSYSDVNELIKLKYLMNNNYDPSEDLEKALKGAMRENDRTRLLLNLGSYYLFIKRDLLQSLKYFNEVIKDGMVSPFMMNFKIPYHQMYEPINLYHYLANEALLYLQNKNSRIESDNKVKSELNRLLESINSICPQLADLKPNRHLIQILCDQSREMLARDNASSHWYGFNTQRERRSDSFNTIYDSDTRFNMNSENRGAKCYRIIRKPRQEPSSQLEAYDKKEGYKCEGQSHGKKTVRFLP